MQQNSSKHSISLTSKGYSTNLHGFGQGYLKSVSKHTRLSQALKVDPKVQRRYVQAQLNEMAEKTLDLQHRKEEIDAFLENQDKWMR